MGVNLHKNHRAGVLLALFAFAGLLASLAADSGNKGFVFYITGRSAATFDADDIFNATGVKSGLIVHLGSGDGQLTAALNANAGYTVQGLDADASDVAQARSYIRQMGKYGNVSVRQLNNTTLPYIDNLINMVVVSDASGVSAAEIARVLCPYGVLIAKTGTFGSWPANLTPAGGSSGWMMAVKKYPDEMDEWPQFLHDSDNNAVASDTLVGPPRHLQWTAEPRWSRSHMAISTIISMVSANGRLFSIEDRAPVENPFLPGEFYLIARGAFNGIELWRHKFTNWESITRYIKDMAVQLQRRLLVNGDTVYCTPGLTAPVTAFDAGDGTILKTFAGTEDTQELVYHDNVLYLVIGDRMNAASYNIVKLGSKGISFGGSDPAASFDGCGFDAGYTLERPNITNAVCDIVALNADTGAELWRKGGLTNYIAGTLAMKGQSAVYQTTNGLFCLNRITGSEIWAVDKVISSGDGTSPNTLILTADAVYAREGGSIFAYSMADGSPLWNGSISDNYEKSPDIFFAAGAIWTGGKGKPTSRNPQTGVQISQHTQVKLKPMGHDRCYRNFITENFYINSKTGGADFVKLSDGTELPNFWVRGTCGFGLLPCNGLLYSTPFSCQCSIEVMIKNMNAFYAEPGLTASDDPVPVATNDVLVTGPAYGYIDSGYTETGWPTYRHDGSRGASTTGAVSGNGLTKQWDFQMTTTPSALTAEDGKVFVSDIDAHTVYALDMTNGSNLWNYVADGRVDSPPTFYKGLVIFGSRDGWVHCLKADTGEMSWKFRSLPEKMLCAFGQFESPWPVCGSVLVQDGVAYFAAGRNSFVDGGIFQFGLNPATGRVVYRSHIYGPFDADGFPESSDNQGYESGIFVTGGGKLHLRHKAFNTDLSVATAANHLIASGGFLDPGPQHRSYWRFNTGYGGKNKVSDAPDIIAVDGSDLYSINGFPVVRHSYFDPRLAGYELLKTGVWTNRAPLSSQAMLLANDVLFVAGNPVKEKLSYDPADPFAEVTEYVASYKGQRGGVLRAVSKADGSTLADYTLDASPAWDGMAAADGKLFISLRDGSVECWGE